MGVFGIGTNVIKIDSGKLRGKTYPVACMTWFTPGHAPRPLLIKYEDQEGIIQTVSEIMIKSTYDKVYDGEPVNEYKCEAVIGAVIHEFRLIFNILNCRWFMVI